MRRFLVLLSTLSLALGLVLIAPPAAQAASTSRRDADDTQGLDLRRVSLRTQGKRLVVTFTTHDAFTDDDLTGLSAMGIDFAVDGKVRGIAVKSDGTRLRASVCTYALRGATTGRRCTPVRIARSSATTVRVTVPRARIDKGARSYRWRAGAITSTYGGPCSSITPSCIDRLPDSNRFLTWRL